MPTRAPTTICDVDPWSEVASKWGDEQTAGGLPLQRGVNFSIVIERSGAGFEVTIDGVRQPTLDFKQRIAGNVDAVRLQSPKVGYTTWDVRLYTTVDMLLATAVPTKAPTANPSSRPTFAPTVAPTGFPTLVPTPLPTASPTMPPTSPPTAVPSFSPTPRPTNAGDTNPPTQSPTPDPTPIPTLLPTPASLVDEADETLIDLGDIAVPSFVDPGLVVESDDGGEVQDTDEETT